LCDEPGELVIPAPATAEVDYLLGRRLGRAARLAFLDDLAAGRFTVAGLDAADHAVVADLERRIRTWTSVWPIWPRSCPVADLRGPGRKFFGVLASSHPASW
jgi:hypothetical protein